VSQMKTLLLLIASLLWLAACATPQYKLMSRLKTGMDKTDVLELLGSPNHSRYSHGQHEWVYVYEKGPQQMAKILYFKKGVLTSFKDYDLHSNEVSPAAAETMKEYEKSVEKKRQESSEGFEDL